MSVAVAICTRDRAEALARCLESVLASPLVDEILVSSDGVDQGTDELMWATVERDRRVRFLRGPRTGLAANRNACIREARSDHLLFLDDDARLSPGFLAAALSLTGPGRIVTGWEMRGALRVTPHHPDLMGFQRLAPVPPLSAIVINATLFPTEFLRTWEFDEFYQFGSEEIDIAMLAVSLGMEVVTVDAGNEHDHLAGARAGNELKAIRSRLYFNVRRFSRYERRPWRLAASVGLATTNAMGHGFKTGGVPGLVRAGREVAAGISASVARRRSPRGHPPEVTWPHRNGEASVSVIVPSYRRPGQLRDCLVGLFAQQRAADEILVVRRIEDAPTAGVLRAFGQVKEVVVSEEGVLAALKAGASAACGSIVAFIDDDAVPRRDWLELLLGPYSSPAVAAVGGRDVVWHFGQLEDGARENVGRLTWYGRLVGNHHLGAGRARPVETLKGCNCSFRREALRLPSGLRGRGAQVGHDLASSLWLSASGATVVYEPRAMVDHYPGERFDDDGRVHRSRQAALDQIYNETYVIGSIYSDRRLARLGYVAASETLRLGRTHGSRGSASGWGPRVWTAFRAGADARRQPLRFQSLVPAPQEDSSPDGQPSTRSWPT